MADEQRIVGREEFRYGFGNALTPAESGELHERPTIPSPGRPLFQAALADFARRSPAAVATGNADRGPLLMISGQADHTVPDVVTRSAYKRYGDSPTVTDLKQFPDRGHALVVDHGRRTVAEYALPWSADQDIHGREATRA